MLHNWGPEGLSPTLPTKSHAPGLPTALRCGPSISSDLCRAMVTPALNDQDSSLVRLYMTACFSQWEKLAPIAREFYAAGGSVAELRGCVRHLIV